MENTSESINDWRIASYDEVQTINQYSEKALKSKFINLLTIAGVVELIVIMFGIAFSSMAVQGESLIVEGVVFILIMTALIVAGSFFINKLHKKHHQEIVDRAYQVCEVSVVSKKEVQRRGSSSGFYVTVKLPNGEEKELKTIPYIFDMAQMDSEAILLKFNDDASYGYYDDYDLVVLK